MNAFDNLPGLYTVDYTLSRILIFKITLYADDAGIAYGYHFAYKKWVTFQIEIKHLKIYEK